MAGEPRDRLVVQRGACARLSEAVVDLIRQVALEPREKAVVGRAAVNESRQQRTPLGAQREEPRRVLPTAPTLLVSALQAELAGRAREVAHLEGGDLAHAGA